MGPLQFQVFAEQMRCEALPMPSPQQAMGWDPSSSNQAPEKRALRVQGARQACQWVGHLGSHWALVYL